MSFKIAFIGAGSIGFTRTLLTDILGDLINGEIHHIQRHKVS